MLRSIEKLEADRWCLTYLTTSNPTIKRLAVSSSLSAFCYDTFSRPWCPAPANQANEPNSGVPQRIQITASHHSGQTQGHLHSVALFRFYPNYYNGGNVKVVKVQMRYYLPLPFSVLNFWSKLSQFSTLTALRTYLKKPTQLTCSRNIIMGQHQIPTWCRWAGLSAGSGSLGLCQLKCNTEHWTLENHRIICVGRGT